MTDKKTKKQRRYPGIYAVKGQFGISYGIDYIHPQSRKRIRKIIKGCKSEAGAFEKRSIEIADAARGAIDKAYGLKPRGPAVLFEDMIDDYLKNWAQQNKEYWTDKHRSATLKKAFAGKLMSDITPWMVEKFKVAMAKKRAKSTINRYLSLCSQVFVKAVEWQKYSGENPFLAVKRFKIKRKKKPGILSVEQVNDILAEVKHKIKRDMIEFAFNTGWRISEITGLKWEDANLKAGAAWIVDPKNKQPAEIELNDRAIELVAGQKRRGQFVFCHKNGNRYKTKLTACFKNAAARAGVYLPPRKAWHMLRRTWASMVLQSGGDVETLRQLGNWKDFSMPMWYAEAGDKEHKRKILNRIPKVDGRKLPEIKRVVNLSDRKNK